MIHYQSVGHDASISVTPDDDDAGTVTVEIVVGEQAEARLTMWAEDFSRMAHGALAHDVEFTNEEIGQIYYAAGHLQSAEEWPEDRHAADSRELGLDVLRKIIAAREAAVKAGLEALFAGGPDTPCRTTYRDGVEYVEIPMSDLQAAFRKGEKYE